MQPDVDRQQLMEAMSHVAGAGGQNNLSLYWRQLAPELNCV
jgi:hypothetical protein